MRRVNLVWITWEVHRRNRELSKAIGAKLIELSEFDSMPKVVRYLLAPMKTLWIFFKNRPSIIICQNPSIVLSFMMVVIKALTGVKVVVDAHYEGIVPKNGKYKLLNLITKFIHRYATFVIVTTKHHKRFVEKNGGMAFVLPDKFPLIPKTGPQALKGKNNILYICSFNEDEPCEEVIEATKMIDPDIHLYITGDYKKKGLSAEDMPPNVTLTGYLPEYEFISLLNSVDVIMDLTTRENCLVCGAYESVSAGKPMILSKKDALMDYFNRGAIYCENNAKEIASAINKTFIFKEALAADIKLLRTERSRKWEQYKLEIINALRAIET